MQIYAIRHKETKKLLRVSVFSNEGGEFCNDVGARFETGGITNSVYIVDDREIALRSLNKNPDWYNACLEYPMWPSKTFNPIDYEIVTINVLDHQLDF